MRDEEAFARNRRIRKIHALPPFVNHGCGKGRLGLNQPFVASDAPAVRTSRLSNEAPQRQINAASGSSPENRFCRVRTLALSRMRGFDSLARPKCPQSIHSPQLTSLLLTDVQTCVLLRVSSRTNLAGAPILSSNSFTAFAWDS